MKYQSKAGQDKWALTHLNHKKNGYFVDVGAHNGETDSHTLVMERDLGWKGICVEPNPLFRSFESLIKCRKCICENVAITSSNGEVDFVARGTNAQLSGIYDKKFSDLSVRKQVEQKNHNLIQVPSMTLEALLDKHEAPTVIDYINIDTEGAEWEILRVFDFSKYTFRTMTIEHNYYSGNDFDPACKVKKDNIQKLLESKGYKFDKSVKADDWYIYIG